MDGRKEANSRSSTVRFGQKPLKRSETLKIRQEAVELNLDKRRRGKSKSPSKVLFHGWRRSAPNKSAKVGTAFETSNHDDMDPTKQNRKPFFQGED